MPTSKGSGKGRNSTPTAQADRHDRPARVVRIKNIRGNIWANRLEGGQVVYNVSFDRIYRSDDKVDDGGQVIEKGEWKQSGSFGRDDLLLLAKVADLCHTWIFRRVQDNSQDQSF